MTQPELRGQRVRQLLPETNGDSVIMELVTAAGLLHGQLMEIQRGKMPDQAFLEKIVAHMAGAAAGSPGDHGPDKEPARRLRPRSPCFRPIEF